MSIIKTGAKAVGIVAGYAALSAVAGYFDESYGNDDKSYMSTAKGVVHGISMNKPYEWAKNWGKGQ